MDQPKLATPAWLPWATIACLAALVACLGEFWFVERARNQLLKDESQLAESEVQGVDNQLEAERIVSRREIDRLRPTAESAGRMVALLEPPRVEGAPGSPKAGAVVWDPASGSGILVTSDGALPPANTDYRLWLEVPDRVQPECCGVFPSNPGSAGAAVHVDASAAEAPKASFVLVIGIKGQAPALGGLIPVGSIVLATPPAGGRISPR